jgi:hypothetical protein
MKPILYVFLLILALFVYSCGGNNKQTQSNISGTIEDETKFAQNLYGEKSEILLKGDLLGNGKICAIAAIVKQKTEKSFWVEKASFFGKDKDNWQVLLKMETKLSSAKGELISQADAKNGYIISFDTTIKPVTINIVMANEYGKAASDDGMIIWNSKLNDFEFKAPGDDTRPQ